MDLNSLKDPHNSRCNISPLNDNSNTSGTNVTKLNESTLVKLEQKEIKHFEIDDDDDDDDDCVVLSEQQVPVKQMIATTSVVNVPKLIKINKHPHYIKSSSDISNNTSGTKVTKFNESISTKLQAQDTGNVKIRDKHDVEISKRQRPVNQIMETTSVINENNLHKISSSLDNSNSRTDKEIIKLNESTSTKVQERKKTEHFKVGDKNVVETFNQQVPIKHTIPTASVIKSPTINVKDINFRKSHMELSNLVKINNKKRNIEVAKLNKSTSTKVYEQKTPVNLRILDNFSNYEKSKLIPYEKVIKTSFVINTPKKIPNKIFVKPNNFSLNLEKIAVPKTVMSNVKTLPSFMSSQIKKPSTISIPSTTHINPKKPIITRLQPKLNPVNITNNKCVSTSKPGFKIISSNDLKSKMVLFPQNKGKYVLTNIDNRKVTNFPSYISTSPMSKPSNSIIPVTVAEKFNTVEKPKIKNIKSKFVVSFKAFQNQKFKALPIEKNIVFKKFINLFKSNVKFQPIQQSSTNSFIRKQKRKLKPHTDSSSSKIIKIDLSTTESEHNQHEKELSLNKNKNLTDFGNLSRPIKHIPHTITSKDVIKNHTNMVIINDKTKINTNVKKNLCPVPGFIQLSSKPESLIKTYGQSTKYGNFTTKEPNTVRLVHFNSINQSKTKLNANVHGDGKHVLVQFLKNNNSNSNSTIAKVPTDKMLKIIPNKVHVPQYQKINTATNEKNMIYPHVSFLEPWKRSSKSNTHAKTSRMTKSVPVKMIMPKISQSVSGPFNQCEYEYCDTIAYKPEMIDYKYCSLVCKSLNTKLMIATQKPKPIAAAQPQENTDLSKKPVIDRKMLLAKLRSRINKRKQSLPSFQKENVSGHDLDQVEQLNKMALKMPPPAIPITVNHSLPYKRKFFNLNEASAVVQNCKQETAKIFSYLQHTDYIPAPRKLFDNPFPHDSNPFKIGQRLEGIDPEHEALFCVMTVVEVCGYRIKLNFDGYSDIYNFWVNADCPDLFFPRWCEQNSRTLQPPKNYNQPFKWTDYLKIPGVMPAPKWNFPNALNTNRITNHSFRIRAKLEALDKLTRTTSKPLICVATVADILGNRIRIHFDGWADDFDYWTDITSTNIHPVGWCDKNGRSLCPPSGYDNCKGKKPFSWANYLKETNSEPVPEDAFFRRPLREFTNSMAIEVVDIANPSLIRIAKVVDVKGDELKILYDGFDTIYAYWIEDDNPNIHPLGWCLKTNHPIELFKANSILWTCRVPGCNGKGNVNNSKNTHVLAKDCPYEFESWKKLISGLAIKPDRIKPEDYLIPSVPSFLEPVSTVAPKEDKKKGKLKSNKIKICNFKKPTKKFSNRSKMNFKKKVPNGRSKCVYKRAVDAMDELDVIIGVNDYTSYGYGSFKRPRLNVWTRHSVLQGVPIFNTTDVRKWPVREVATFVEIVVSNNYTDDDPSDRIKISKSFINQEIDGDVFLMLTQKDLMDILNIPLGPALKLHNAIVVLRQRTSTLDVVNGLSKLKQK
ncbi:uncharacterized protein LOC112593910 isoform X2 [Melanaphis sacchari]|uniref:uncharacterized protein LOC112593910 isoform X2 n=1 Tax=Melanaphis sacchari TaxID=742174 RepID=UPI000DC13E63|nr:uncharacterized protein LOC112593910 isoform X2 [Melanaphis sacchari]